MKNRISDLTDHLFAQMERLGDELEGESLERECRRSEAMVKIADQIVTNANLQLRATALIAEHGAEYRDYMPTLLGRAS